MDKWKVLGYVAAIFDPVPTGLFSGYCLYTDKKYKKTGRNVIVLSIIWAVLMYAVLFA